MAKLQDYSVDTMYENGWDYAAGDIRVGRETYSLIRPLFPGTSRPRLFRLAATADAVADDISLSLAITDYADFNDTTATATSAAGETIRLSRGDVLNFGTEASPVIAVINEDKVIDDSVAGIAVEVLPLIADIGSTAGDTCFTYAMVPIQFVATGGMFDNASNIATANNKSTGYWELKATTSRNATSTLSGAMITSDYSMYIFEALNGGGRFAYYEVRYYPATPFNYIDDVGAQSKGYGSGPGSARATVTSNFKVTPDATEIIQVEGSIEAVGKPLDYVIMSNDSSEPSKFTWA
jgi:hypothetical protein